ncbi:MAG: class I SAM-dependent methyltransferase [Bacteroidota bacterium]
MKYRKQDLFKSITGKIEIGSYIIQHAGRFVTIIREIDNLYRSIPQKKAIRILDFGSHTGAISIGLKNQGYDVYCADIETVVNEYRHIYDQSGLPIKILESGYHIPYDDKFFDCVVFSEVLEHMYDSPIELLTEFKRIIKNDGYLLLTTPNVMKIENKIKYFLNMNIYQDIHSYTYNPRFWLHFREYTAKDLKILLGEYMKFSSVKIVMFNNASGRTPVKRFFQRCMFVFSYPLPMFKGFLMAIARNSPDRPLSS